MYFLRTRNAGVGDFFLLGSAIKAAPPLSMFMRCRPLNPGVDIFQFLTGFGQGLAGHLDTALYLNIEPGSTFDRMVGFGNYSDTEVNTTRAQPGIWGNHSGTATSATVRSVAGMYSNDGTGGDYREVEGAGVSLTGFDRTSIGAEAHSPSTQAHMTGEVIQCAAWSTVLTEIQERMLCLGAHPLNVGLQSLIAYWDMDSPYPKSFIGTFANMTITGEPKVLSRPVAVRGNIWQPVIARSAGSVVTEGRRQIGT